MHLFVTIVKTAQCLKRRISGCLKRPCLSLKLLQTQSGSAPTAFRHSQLLPSQYKILLKTTKRIRGWTGSLIFRHPSVLERPRKKYWRCALPARGRGFESSPPSQLLQLLGSRVQSCLQLCQATHAKRMEIERHRASRSFPQKDKHQDRKSNSAQAMNACRTPISSQEMSSAAENESRHTFIPAVGEVCKARWKEESKEEQKESYHLVLRPPWMASTSTPSPWTVLLDQA
jgi:hypothetical protein